MIDDDYVFANSAFIYVFWNVLVLTPIVLKLVVVLVRLES